MSRYPFAHFLSFGHHSPVRRCDVDRVENRQNGSRENVIGVESEAHGPTRPLSA
jgi:hypothetical protein